jgi:drug/metabolite transporter (DMT)-like permease
MWIILTIIAATLQAFRNLEQKNLNKKLDYITVSWSRFILPFPLALIVVWWSFAEVNNQFIFYCVVTAVLQITANIFLLKTVKSRNFTIGVLFYKTEVLQTALLGLLLFNQKISAIGYLAILIAAFGMFLMSDIDLKKYKFDKSIIFGILSGLCFAICAFNLKFASESLIATGHSVLFTSSSVLMWVIALQNVFLAAIKIYQKSLISDLKKLFTSENRKSFLSASILSFAGSVCWFTAFTIGNVVYVKAVGQVELIIAAFISHLYLKEHHKRKEIAGIVITSLAILAVIVFG